MEMAKAESAGRRRQIEDKQRTEPWEEVAIFAAYCCQREALSLKPWQEPPMHAGADRPLDSSPLMGHVAAWELRRRLLAAGLSVFEPDPVRALEKAGHPPQAQG
jgi:hypothetical protein